MQRRTSSTNGTWTPQQRLFVALAVVLCVVALTICVVRLQSDPAPVGPRDGTEAPVSRTLLAGQR